MAKGQQQGVNAITVWMIVFVGMWLTSTVFLVILYTGQEKLNEENVRLRASYAKTINDQQQRSIELAKNASLEDCLMAGRRNCAPIEVPEKVMLVIQPMGGPDDWRALFHEAGHTEHFAHTSPDLPMEEKRLGDNAVTEGWAMLLEQLTNDPAWLSRRLDFPDPQGFAGEGAVQLLWLVRRYSAKLLYELEFFAADDPLALEPRYVELLTDALKIEPGAADYLGDIDAGFYVTSYLRSWAFEAQLRSFLRERWGTTWFTRREAGSLLRELWELGQKPTADELLKDVTGAPIELEAVADKIRETLPAPR